jgi:hypothetical protein
VANDVSSPLEHALYTITGIVGFCPQTTHYSVLVIKLNGSALRDSISPGAIGCRTVSAHETLSLVHGDSLTMEVFDSANGPTSGISKIITS